MRSLLSHPDELRRLQNIPPKQEDLEIMESMVRWFDPTVLFKVIKPVFLSGIFGKYADRRLIHAALDNSTPKEQLKFGDIRSSLPPDDEGAVWFDYVADTGVGFDATYAIAYSIAKADVRSRVSSGVLRILYGYQKLRMERLQR